LTDQKKLEVLRSRAYENIGHIFSHFGKLRETLVTTSSASAAHAKTQISSILSEDFRKQT